MGADRYRADHIQARREASQLGFTSFPLTSRPGGTEVLGTEWPSHEKNYRIGTDAMASAQG